MEIFDFGFITIRLLDIIDIILVAFLMYQLYNLLRGSVAITIFIGLLSIYLLWLFVRALDMKLLSGILGQFIGVGVLALIIVFQQEIRRFLILIGKQSFLNKNSFWRKYLPWNMNIDLTDTFNLSPVIKAIVTMSESMTGAIIVITRDAELKFYTNTGEELDANLSTGLLESIFHKNSPLHDGAAIISGEKIVAARCVLPVTDNRDLPSHFGLRHRAAIGITENSDALAIIVSEETGYISLASKGTINYKVNPDELEALIKETLSEN